MTFGIVARRPETGYATSSKRRCCDDRRLGGRALRREACAPELAEQYVASGDYDWNSGMFLFRPAAIWTSFEAHRPTSGPHAARLRPAAVRPGPCASTRQRFEPARRGQSTTRSPEKTSSAGWCRWMRAGATLAPSPLWEVLPHDEHGNVHRGDVISHDSHEDNLVSPRTRWSPPSACATMSWCRPKDAGDIAPRDRAGEVKQIVARLKASGRNEHQVHREVYRPWGQYDSIDHGDRYQVKRITVKPGQKLSVQMHPPPRRALDRGQGARRA